MGADSKDEHRRELSSGVGSFTVAKFLCFNSSRKTQALEHTPEMFGIVTMLYVNMEVNGVRVQAFVDTGAQMTIMSADFAEKCSLMRLIDKRYAGMAYGVGQSKLLGRVHQAQLKVGGEYMASSLSVIEQNTGPPFIFGLDNLVRHQVLVYLVLSPPALTVMCGSVYCRFEGHEIGHRQRQRRGAFSC